MLIYNLDEIETISHNIENLNIQEFNINDFLKSYIQVEKNDKYEPIFSLTSKYKSFPVNSNRSTKNFFQNNKWKISNTNVLKINQDLKLSLNKLSERTYEKVKNDIFIIFKKDNNKNTFDIFMKELFEKIWFDEKFLELYVSLCYHIWSDETINCSFEFILDYCNSEFKKRDIYKTKMLESNTEDKIFINKRKIIGTVEFMANLYIKEHIDNIRISNIIDSLLIKSNNDIDYECFYKLWNIIINNNRLEDDIIFKYKEILLKNISNIKNNRIKILLTTLIEKMNFKVDNNNITYINKCIIEFKKNKDLSKIVTKLKQVDKSLVMNELIINELENKSNIFIEIILLLTDRSELLNILDSINLDELEIDIPNVRKTFEELKHNLKI
tara:strand:+ start:39 stop:1190 length:1152 start_codon:yes stop_codon:yes gene_type:complete